MWSKKIRPCGADFGWEDFGGKIAQCGDGVEGVGD